MRKMTKILSTLMCVIMVFGLIVGSGLVLVSADEPVAIPASDPVALPTDAVAEPMADPTPEDEERLTWPNTEGGRTYVGDDEYPLTAGSIWEELGSFTPSTGVAEIKFDLDTNQMLGASMEWNSRTNICFTAAAYGSTGRPSQEASQSMTSFWFSKNAANDALTAELAYGGNNGSRKALNDDSGNPFVFSKDKTYTVRVIVDFRTKTNTVYLQEKGVGSFVKAIDAELFYTGGSTTAYALDAMTNIGLFQDGGYSSADYPNGAGHQVAGSGMKNITMRSYTMTEQTPAVVPSIAPGVFDTKQSIMLSSAPGAVIFYTLDGTEPTVDSTKYAGAIAMSGDVTTINAIAVDGGYLPSDVGTFAYTYDPPKVPAITASVPSGTSDRVLNVVLRCVDMPAATIYYTIEEGGTPADPTAIPANKYTGPIFVPTTATIKAMGVLEGSSKDDSDIASFTYTFTDVIQVQKPVITLPGGEYAPTPVKYTQITCGTPGAQIKYTTDGSDPLTSATAVSYVSGTNIEIDQDMTITVAATRNNMADSEAASANYVLNSNIVASDSRNLKTLYVAGEKATVMLAEASGQVIISTAMAANALVEAEALSATASIAVSKNDTGDGVDPSDNFSLTNSISQYVTGLQDQDTLYIKVQSELGTIKVYKIKVIVRANISDAYEVDLYDGTIPYERRAGWKFLMPYTGRTKFEFDYIARALHGPTENLSADDIASIGMSYHQIILNSAAPSDATSRTTDAIFIKFLADATSPTGYIFTVQNGPAHRNDWVDKIPVVLNPAVAPDGDDPSAVSHHIIVYADLTPFGQTFSIEIDGKVLAEDYFYIGAPNTVSTISYLRHGLNNHKSSEIKNMNIVQEIVNNHENVDPGDTIDRIAPANKSAVQVPFPRAYVPYLPDDADADKRDSLSTSFKLNVAAGAEGSIAYSAKGVPIKADHSNPVGLFISAGSSASTFTLGGNNGIRAIELNRGQEYNIGVKMIWGDVTRTSTSSDDPPIVTHTTTYDMIKYQISVDGVTLPDSNGNGIGQADVRSAPGSYVVRNLGLMTVKSDPVSAGATTYKSGITITDHAVNSYIIQDDNPRLQDDGTTIYYVGPERRYKTPAEAMGLLVAGDVMEIEGDQIYRNDPGKQLTIGVAGTENLPITIRGKAVNGKKPIITGSDGSIVVSVSGNNVTLEGLDVRGTLKDVFTKEVLETYFYGDGYLDDWKGDNDAPISNDTRGNYRDDYKIDMIALARRNSRKQEELGRQVSARVIYQLGHNLTIRNCVARDGRQGIIGADNGSGSAWIEFSEVLHNGVFSGEHNMYMASDASLYPNSRLRVQFIYSHDGMYGLALKTRCRRNEIYNNVLVGAEATAMDILGPDQGSNNGHYINSEGVILDYARAEDYMREDTNIVGNLFISDYGYVTIRLGGDGGSGGTLRNGTSFGRFRLLNNTFMDLTSKEKLRGGGTTGIRFTHGVTSIELYNNIFYCPNGPMDVVNFNPVQDFYGFGHTTSNMRWANGRQVTGASNWVKAGDYGVPAEFMSTITGTAPEFVAPSIHPVLGVEYDAYRPSAGSKLATGGTRNILKTWDVESYFMKDPRPGGQTTKDNKFILNDNDFADNTLRLMNTKDSIAPGAPIYEPVDHLLLQHMIRNGATTEEIRSAVIKERNDVGGLVVGAYGLPDGSGRVEKVTFSPDPAVKYRNPITVTMSTVTTGSNIQIRYTMDGTEPTKNSSLYDPSNPPVLGGSAYVKAIGVDANGVLLSSTVSTVHYTIDTDKPLSEHMPGAVNPPAGSNPNNQIEDDGGIEVVIPPEIRPQVDSFWDLDDAAWASASIENMTAKGFMSGYPDKTFKPNRPMTRAEFAKVVASVFNMEYAGNSTQFNDVKSGDWYYSPVMVLFQNEVIKGITSSEFGADNLITRQDMCVIIARALDAAGIELDDVIAYTGFDDDNKIGDYAKDAVKLLYTKGIIKGMNDDNFAPLENATRAQVTVMLERLYGQMLTAQSKAQ